MLEIWSLLNLSLGPNIDVWDLEIATSKYPCFGIFLGCISADLMRTSATNVVEPANVRGLALKMENSTNKPGDVNDTINKQLMGRQCIIQQSHK
jgi:hypothetical protein